MIAEKALSIPENTEALMQLKEFMKKVETDTIYQLEKKLTQAKNRLRFLVDYAQFSPAEMRMNSSTFLWNARMPTVFEEHKVIINEKKVQYEEGLKVSFYIAG